MLPPHTAKHQSWGGNMNFTSEQIEQLRAPLSKDNIATRSQAGQTLSYIEGHHAIREANRIFGFDGWTRETVYCTEVCRSEYENNQGKQMLKVGYEAKVRVTVNGMWREGTGHGQATVGNGKPNQMLFEAIEGAAKEAETDAMKRALMTFGDQFGLALYDKQQKHVVEYVPTPEEKVDPDSPYFDAKEAAVYLSDKLKEFDNAGGIIAYFNTEKVKKRIASLPQKWQEQLFVRKDARINELNNQENENAQI